MIKDLKRDGEGFFWTFKGYKCLLGRGPQDVEMRTDDRGFGIFRYDDVDHTWHQMAGFCDFELHGYSLSGARKKIKRYFGLSEN